MYIALSSQQGSVYWISLSKFTGLDQNKKTKITYNPPYPSRNIYRHRLYEHSMTSKHQPSAHSDSARPSRQTFKEPSVSSMWSKVISCQYLDSMINSRAVRYPMGGYGGLNFLSDQAGPIFPTLFFILLYFFSFLVDFFLEAGVWAAFGGSGWPVAWGGGRACWVACWAVACCCWGLDVRVAVLPGM